MIAHELWRHRALVWALARRDLVARYRGTALGFLWTFLHPLLYLGVYSLVFDHVAPVGVERYPAFLFAGLLPWTWFSSSLLVSTTSILADAPLVKRAAFPASVPSAVVATGSLVNFLLGLPVLFLVLAFEGVRPTAWVLALPVPIALQFLLGLGLGLGVSALTVRFRDVGQLAAALMPLAFFLTPIVYPAERFPREAAAFLWINPLALLTQSYRSILIDGAAPDPRAVVALAGAAALALVAGAAVLERLRDRIPEEL